MKKILVLLPLLPLLLLCPACQDDIEAQDDADAYDADHDTDHDTHHEPDAAHDASDVAHDTHDVAHDASGDAPGDTHDAAHDAHDMAHDTHDTDHDAPPCPAGVTTSDLPGVSLRFVDAPCVLSLGQAAQGARIRYELIVEAPPEGVPRAVWPRPQDAGGCGQPGDGGLIISEQVQGEQRRWCLCDTGLCQAPEELYTELVPDTYPGEFVWDGVEWEGPSDFGNPPGPPFPAGSGYEFVVSAKGKVRFSGVERDFTVEARAPFSLTP